MALITLGLKVHFQFEPKLALIVMYCYGMHGNIDCWHGRRNCLVVYVSMSNSTIHRIGLVKLLVPEF